MVGNAKDYIVCFNYQVIYCDTIWLLPQKNNY